MTYRIDGNSFEQLMPADEFTYYLTGEYVGDPYDDVLLADGEIVYAADSLEEAEAKKIRIVKEAGLEPLFDTEEAVRKAVSIANGGAR